MNDPKPLHAVAPSVLDPEAGRGEGRRTCRRGVVPRSCTRLTALIDVGAARPLVRVVAWDERFGGSVIDYGPYPDQARVYFAAADARPTLGDLPAWPASRRRP
jgi:hypothetical protein